MSDFIIPQGKEFVFTVTVMEKDSFLTQDVEMFDPTISDVKFRELSTMTITPGTVIMVKIPDDTTVTPLTYKSGRIKVTIPDTLTTQMSFERGEKVDGYYLKPTYEAIITIGFSDSTPTRTVILQDIYVIPAM